MKFPNNPNFSNSRIYKFTKYTPDNINYNLKDNILENNVENIFTSTETINNLIINKITQYNGEKSYIFGLPGAAWDDFDNDLQNAITNNKLQYIHASNESAGIYMAAYEAELKNKVGIHFSTSGPGATMSVTAINSLFGETKSCIIFLGVSSGSFQEENTTDRNIMSTICKKTFYINNNTLNPQQILDDAFYIAKNGTNEFIGPGPVCIFIDNIWTNTYKYTLNTVPYNITSISQLQINNIINKIIGNINNNSKIILRIGERVNINIIQQFAELTQIYSNIFLQLTASAKMYLNIDNYINCGVEGPMSNQIVNSNYDIATLVIQIGVGIEYSNSIFVDIGPLLKMPEAKLFYITDNSLHFPNSANSLNSIVTDVNLFSTNLLNKIYFTLSTNNLFSWNITKIQQNNYSVSLLNKYKIQKNSTTNVLTTMSIVAQIFDVIYKLQSYNNGVINNMIIDDNYLYSTDVGLGAYISDSLIYHKKINNIINFLQFGPIGVSTPCLAGRLLSDQYEGAINIIGDGAFLNSPGYFIDLTNILTQNSNKRCLIILLNDNSYTAVKVSEEALFGNSTSIVKTNTLQVNLDINILAKAFMGTKLIQSLEISELTNNSNELSNFINNWYNKTNGFTEGGYYLIYYKTTTGTPFIEK
jgi:thiamine pyrophosphate-dependent acetolactate synthase large subunit-like protein